MEFAKSSMKLTPEQRRRQMYQELKAMEVERRQRVALEKEEAKEERKRLEAVEREKVKERIRLETEEKEKVRQKRTRLGRIKGDQLKKESLECEVAAQEELKRCTFRALNKVELDSPLTVEDKANPKSVTFDLKPAGMKTLYNNWIGETPLDSKPVGENTHLDSSSVYFLFAAKPHPKSKGNPQKSKPRKTVQWIKDKAILLVDMYCDQREMRSEEPKLTSEKQHRTTF